MKQPRVYECLSHGLLIKLTASGINFLLWDRLQIQSETAGNSHKGHATIALVDIPCLAGRYCSMQGWLQRKTISVSSPPAACAVPCSILKASQQGGSFLFVSSRLMFLYPARKVCGVSSNGVLPFRYGGKPRTMTTAYATLGASGASLTNNS